MSFTGQFHLRQRLRPGADRVVGRKLATSLVGAQFPWLPTASAKLLGHGSDNTVWLFDRAWTLRFPRSPAAVPLARRERAVLPQLAAHLPLPVPVPELQGTPGPGYPWEFTGARLIHGQELALGGLSPDQRTQVAADCGTFLRALHQASVPETLLRALPVDPQRRAEPTSLLHRVRPLLHSLRRRRRLRHDSSLDLLLDRAGGLGPTQAPLVLVHGDLHLRHVLVHGQGRSARARGVIDWGDVCRADPAVDLSLAYGAFDGPSRSALLHAYGHVDAETELRARTLSVFLCARLAASAGRLGRPELRTEALRGIRRSAA